RTWPAAAVRGRRARGGAHTPTTASHWGSTYSAMEGVPTVPTTYERSMAAHRTRATTCENSFRRPRWVLRAAVARFARNASILPVTKCVAQRLNFGLPPVAGWPDAAGHGRGRSQGVENAN